MQIVINIDPRFPRWLKRGLVYGVVPAFLLGAAFVYADVTAPVFTAKEPLSAAKMTTSFKTLTDSVNSLQVKVDAQQTTISGLQTRVEAQQATITDLTDQLATIKNPDCPKGYTRDTTLTNIVLCKKGRDEVVKVGTDPSAFWIDRYEASLWQSPDGTGTPLGQNVYDYPAGFPGNGQYSTPIYALSVAGVAWPSVQMTWFQAQQACRLSGKRLPSGEEWLAAAAGTPDPGENAGTGGVCVTRGSAPHATGAGTLCQSRWGAQDMIGNVWEWTADWYAGLGAADISSSSTWVDPTIGIPTTYNGDGTWNVVSKAFAAGMEPQAGQPAAALRGGGWEEGSVVGLFALYLASAPSTWHHDTGCRCALLSG